MKTAGEHFHVPVLLKEVLSFIPSSARTIIDGTVGHGGHTEAICSAFPSITTVLGIDRDPEILKVTQQRLKPFGSRVRLQEGRFNQIAEILQKNDITSVDGILLDLGFATPQLLSGRGFSFERDEPLDMRYAPDGGATAADLLAKKSEHELAEIFFTHGDESLAKFIAHRVIKVRSSSPIRRTGQLVDLILSAYRDKLKSKREVPWIGGIHPATRVFQALRIAVNNELEIIKNALPQCVDALSPGGRLLIISYHSGEDRIIKQFFKQESHGCICPPQFPSCVCDHTALLRILTKKPITATAQEITNNPSSRSAKLRVAEKIKPHVKR